MVQPVLVRHSVVYLSQNMPLSQMLCVYMAFLRIFFVSLGCAGFNYEPFCLQEIAKNLARLSIDALARLGGYLSM